VTDEVVHMPDVDVTETDEDMPVLSTITAMTAVSLEECDLEPRDTMLARVAALAAVGAPPASYHLNAGAAADVGVTIEDVQGILVAVAPIIGTARTMMAAGNITEALGFAIAVMEAELEATET
jgi:alkylhydroperoxidase/carboxymuconolactone decarboxylase family protein YurZ